MKIGYVRVSTEEQNTARQEVLMQELGVDEVYIDKVSGKNTQRPQLQKMMQYVRKGDTVIVESISRFARNTKDLLELVEALSVKEVIFISKKEAIDTTTPTGKFMLTVFGAVAELEREYILQRQREGIEIAKREGKYHGRKPRELPDFDKVTQRWKAGELTAAQACRCQYVDFSFNVDESREQEFKWDNLPVYIPKENEEEFKNAYTIYALHEIKHWEKKKMCNRVCGWNDFVRRGTLKACYAGVHPKSSYLDLRQLFLCVTENAPSPEEAAHTLTSLLAHNPALTPLLGYLFLSVSHHILHTAEIHKQPQPTFGLCIYGENRDTTPTEIANMLLNMFYEANPQHHTFSNKVNVEEERLSMSDCQNRRKLKDVTLLVRHKNGKLGKGSKILKEFSSGVVRYFPVFVCKKPILDEKLLCVDISGWTFFKGLVKDFNLIRQAINVAVRKFIKEMSKKSFVEAAWCCPRREEILNNPNADVDVEYYAELYDGLALYLRSPTVQTLYRRCEAGEEDLQYLKELEQQTVDTLRELSQVLPSASVEERFSAYIKAIFIEKTYQPDLLHQEGDDRNGKEECYYLQYDNFADFQAWSKLSENPTTISKALKGTGWFKLGSHGALYCRRKLSGPTEENKVRQSGTTDTLVILKDAISKTWSK